MKIKKVYNRAKTQPVDNIACRAADDQADRDGKEGSADPLQPENQDDDDHSGGKREDQRTDATGAVQDAKADAGIAGQHEIEKRGDRLLVPAASRFAEMQQQRPLAGLIEDRDRRRNGETAPEHQVAPAAARTGIAPRSITSAQRRQRSSWPATWPTSGKTRQQRSQRSPAAGITTTPIPATSS